MIYTRVKCLMVGMALSLMACSAQAQVENEFAEGLKEALKIGTENAVKLVSQEDGFYKNDLIKIMLPKDVQKVQTLLKQAGFEAVVNEFERSMNRAAEKAAVSAASLFGDAIKDMTFEDALKIVKGGENEATLYFQEKTGAALNAAFQPIIETAMAEVGVTSAYQNLQKEVTAAIPFGFGELFEFDLNAYVTERALDGVFSMVAEEEKKIRKNPEARVTELLKKIFK